MSIYTPGPWRLGKVGDCVVADSPGHVRGGDDPESIAYYGGYLIGESISSVNRPLVAAAPDLLEALKAVLAYSHIDEIEPQYLSPEWIADKAKAEAAIAKAEAQP